MQVEQSFNFSFGFFHPSPVRAGEVPQGCARRRGLLAGARRPAGPDVGRQERRRQDQFTRRPVTRFSSVVDYPRLRVDQNIFGFFFLTFQTLLSTKNFRLFLY